MRIRFFALAALALLLGACTQDEAGFLPEGAEGTSIVFTATGLNPAATATAGTRAPVDGNWEGVQSVAVLMDGTVKAYDVTLTTADPTSATLTSTDPYYWTNHNDITVTAWWPYTAGETTPPAVKVKANQSAQKDFEGSDLIVADGQTVTYGSPTLCTPSQLPSTGARVPAVAVAAGFSPVAVKTMDVPSAPSGRKPASSCVQAPSKRASAASAKNLILIISVILLLWFFPLRA